MTTLVEAATARSHRLALALAVSLYGGPRQSETLALRWQDCELERGRLASLLSSVATGNAPS
jgi:integrase